MSFAELVSAVETAAAVQKFFEMDDFRSCIGSLNLASAEEALRRTDLVSDRKAQIRSALTHLEAGHVALTPRRSPIHPAGEEKRRRKRCKVIALEIMCALYLGEQPLAQKLWFDLRETNNRDPYLENDVGNLPTLGSGQLLVFGLSLLVSLPDRVISEDWTIGFDVEAFLRNSRTVVSLSAETPVTREEMEEDG